MNNRPIKRPASPVTCHDQTHQKLLDKFAQAQSHETQLQATITSLTLQLQSYTGKLQDQQRETSRLGQELANWHAADPTPAQVKLTENQQENSLLIKRQKTEGLLRGRDSKLTFGDLSDELLVLVLGLLDYVDQQRITRACKRWKYLITCIIDHIFLDWPAVEARRRLGDYRIFEGFFFRQAFTTDFPASCSDRITVWEQESNVIQRVTFHAGFRTDYTRVFGKVLDFNVLFPQLKVFTLYRLPLEGLVYAIFGNEWYDQYKQPTGLLVKTVDCVVAAFSEYDQLEWEKHVGRAELFHLHLLGGRIDSYLPVEDGVFTDAEQLLDYLMEDNTLTWPYPVEQLAWLRHHAPLLNGSRDAMLALRSLKIPFQDPPLVLMYTPVLCPEHNLLCAHLPESFYLQMPGAALTLIAVFLLQFKLPQLPAPPPFPFPFQRLVLDAARKLYLRVDDPLIYPASAGNGSPTGHWAKIGPDTNDSSTQT